MNWLMVQFFIVLLVPLGFLASIVYLLPRQPGNRPLLTRWWVVTIFLLALWASRQLTPYLGVEVGPVVPYFWEAFANYPLVLAGTPLLLATSLYLARPLNQWRWLLLAGPLLATVAFSLDPALWPGRQGGLLIGQLVIRVFDLWALLWVAAWVVPTLSAWILTEQITRAAPASIYRNQVVYWLVILSLIFFGGTLGLARDLLVVQQAGAIVLLVGTFLGTLAITRSRLPNLPQTARILSYHLLRGLLAFVLSAGVLFGLTTFLLNTVDTTATIMTTAALLALTLLGVMAGVNRLFRRLRRDQSEEKRQGLPFEAIHSGPLRLNDAAATLLEIILERVDASSGWLAIIEERPAGGIVVRPIAGDDVPDAVAFDGTSPFVDHFYQHQIPLTRDDIAYLPEFAASSDMEREIYQNWGQAAYLPLLAHNRLVGLAAVQEKRSGEPHGATDIAEMSRLGREIGPILARSQTVDALIQAADTAQAHNVELKLEWQRLTELVDFYQQFIGLHSPDKLRRPFTDLTVGLQQLEGDLGPQLNGSTTTLHQLQEQVDQSRALVDNLIDVASHLQKQSHFNLGPVYLDEVIRSALVALEDMIQARRVTAELFIRGQLLPVWGDRERLEEAVVQLLHNAIKFNRIEGTIEISCQMQRDEVRLEIRDDGVGIPTERVDALWRGLDQTASLERLGGRRQSRIGLPLVNFIVKAHGGRVEVESRYGHGSTFRVFLPARLAE